MHNRFLFQFKPATMPYDKLADLVRAPTLKLWRKRPKPAEFR
jgi:hypothetical protein